MALLLRATCRTIHALCVSEPFPLKLITLKLTKLDLQWTA
jgi:hypothetical protein